MLQIIQSNQTEQLLKHLIHAYKTQQTHVFDEFIVLVPSMVLGEWVQKSIADTLGISTLITNQFWGQYQLELIGKVLKKYDAQNPQGKVTIPEVAVLSTRVMQWRIFGYLLHHQAQIIKDDKHPLYPLVSKLIDDKAKPSGNTEKNKNKTNNLNPSPNPNNDLSNTRLWQLAEQLAGVFNRYLTHRNDWLALWSASKPLDIAELIKQKDELTAEFSGSDEVIPSPEWLVEHYQQLEVAQHFLWQQLFSDVYQHRVKIENRFWQAMDYFASQFDKAGFNQQLGLPKCLYLFTIQQLPLDEFAFMQRLSHYVDIQLLHYNPSQAYWADIVDKHWFKHQQIINPSIVYLRDYGHTLLSRLGKQERETFATLSSLSGNELALAESGNAYTQAQVEWHNDFVNPAEPFSSFELNEDTANRVVKPSLLNRLQQDVLEMDETLTKTSMQQDAILNMLERQWDFNSIDNSLSIHACHSLQRQLEVLRGMIGKWLNEPSADGSSRHISDIVVMLPDVDSHHDMINSVFVDGVGQDGLALPARVTGVVDKNVRQLWQSICGYYQLLGQNHSRFEAIELFEWLLLPPIYQGFGLSFEQMSRACQLLTEAGFIRGFDEAHLQTSLDTADMDYRFSFAYALDRLVLGLTMPNADLSEVFYPSKLHNLPNLQNTQNLTEKTLPFASVSLNDAPIIDALCKIYLALNKHRNEYHDDDSGLPKQKTAHEWLNHIETETIHPYFSGLDQTRAMRTIFKAMNGLKKNLRASYVYQQVANHENLEQTASNLQIKELPFQLSFILESIEAELESQQVSAEPTGVITFARFGALRTVPFKLVVMLNMNLSEFPRQERDDRYDLMKAGLARRGDRRADDDDNGAFLDALLCAKEDCWIFYNGQSLTDSNEHLPANPVGELIQFLTSEVGWQWQDNVDVDVDESASMNSGIDNSLVGLSEADKQAFKQNLREHIHSRLLTRHPALPFSAEQFETTIQNTDVSGSVDNTDNSIDDSLANFKLAQKRAFPPAPIWSKVYHQLRQTDNTANHKQKVTLVGNDEYQAMAELLSQLMIAPMPTPASAPTPTNQQQPLLSESFDSQAFMLQTTANVLTNLPTHINIEQLAGQIYHTGKLYLRHNQVHIAESEEEGETLEPLALNGLSRYQLNDELIANLDELGNVKAMNGTINNEAINKEASNGFDFAKTHPANKLNQLLFTPLMPAGVARFSTMQAMGDKLNQQLQMLQQTLAEDPLLANLLSNLLSTGLTNHSEHTDNLDSNATGKQLITPVDEQSVQTTTRLFGTQQTIEFKGVIPLIKQDGEAEKDKADEKQANPKVWINLLATKPRSKHLLKFWLRHLFWQVARGTTAEQVAVNDGISIWQFAGASKDINKLADKSVIKLPAVEKSQALHELKKWLVYAQFASLYPLVIMPEYAFKYLDNQAKADEKGEDYFPHGSHFAGWQQPFFGQRIYDSCSQHDVWQYILNTDDNQIQTDVNAALIKALNSLAEVMFEQLYNQVEGI